MQGEDLNHLRHRAGPKRSSLNQACFMFSLTIAVYRRVEEWRRARHKEGPSAVAQCLRSSPCMPRIPYGRRFYPGSPASLPAPCLWPGKAVENTPKLWDPAPAWETQKRLLASDRHSIGRCAHLGSESSDGRSSSLSLLSVYLTLIKIEILLKLRRKDEK